MLVIANADAGSSDGLDDALAVLTEAEVARTSDPGELDEVVARSDFLVVAGGDGSLHAVVNALHRASRLSEVTLALVPLGTGNDFARGAGIPLDPAEAARSVLSGKRSRIDVLVDDRGEIVVNNVHAGAGAEASRAARPWKKVLGALGYAVGAALVAIRPPTFRLRVTVDGVVVSDRPTLQVAVGNAPYVGGGTALTPRAEPDDGKADVLVSYARGPLAMALYALHLRRGEHHRTDDVLYLRGREVAMAGDPFHVSADGEIQGPFVSRVWTTVPGGMQMVLPG